MRLGGSIWNGVKTMFRGIITLWVIFLAVVVMFSFGSISGASMAMNETVDRADMLNQTEELDTLSENATANMSDSGVEGLMKTHAVKPVTDTSETYAIAGVKWGYNNPEKAKVVGYAGPIAFLGTWLFVAYRQVQRIRRSQQ